MGKLKKRSKASLARKQHYDKEKAQNSTKDAKVLPLLAKLQSAVPNDRSMAISAISLLCEDFQTRQLLLKEKLVPIVLEQCLNDNNHEIVVESFGLLRNLVIEESDDIAKYLVRSNIWNTLVVNLTKCHQSFEFFWKGETVKKEEKVLMFDWLENLLYLVLELVDSNEEIGSDIITKLLGPNQAVIQFVNTILSRHTTLPLKVLTCVLTWNYQLCAESTEYVVMLSESQFPMEILSSPPANLNNLCKVLILGLRFHFYSMNTVDPSVVAESLKEILGVVEGVQLDKTGQDSEMHTEILAVDHSLDLIAAVLEFESQDEKFLEPCLPILQDGILPLCASLIKYPEFQAKAIACACNVVLLIPQSAPQVLEYLSGMADFCKHAVFQQETDDKADCVFFLSLVVRMLPVTVTQEQVAALFEMADQVIQSEEHFDVKEKFINSVIIFAGGLVCESSDISLVGDVKNRFTGILQFSISTVLENPKEAHKKYHTLLEQMIVSVLNQFFDVFDDAAKPFDFAVFREGKMLAFLSELLPEYKKVYKFIDKKVDPSLKADSEDAVVNLERFIQYKEGEL